MKFILVAFLVILAITFVSFLLPAIIGIAIGVSLFNSGHYIGAIICIIGGIGMNIGLLCGEFGGLFSGYGSSSGGHSYNDEDDCPYCGSGDTDGNHCYNCDEDF